MTKITKPLVRETDVTERSEAIVVELHPKYLLLRLKGRRGGVTVDYATVLDLARKLAYRRGDRP
jgi:hypothetical protein